MRAVLENGCGGAQDHLDGAIIDCGDRVDVVFGAIDAGWLNFIFSGTEEAAIKLEAIIREAGGALQRVAPAALDLEGADDPGKAAADWILK